MNIYLNLINVNLASEVKKPIPDSFGCTKFLDLVDLTFINLILFASIALLSSILLPLLLTILMTLIFLVDRISITLFSLIAIN